MGRPKKVKRAYHKKEVQEVIENPEIQTDENIEEDTERCCESTCPACDGEDVETFTLEEEESPEPSEELEVVEVKIEPVKKQHQMFHNLEEGRIELEEIERMNRENSKKAEAAALEKVRKEGVDKPKLMCPFCSHIQYSINSKDVTSAWCEACGRCFSAEWK